ncbi:Uncharacterised protein [Acinetobacter junii]|nr:hypothetical protein F948_02047 [Acinetobacter junii CIP 64.5]SUU08856.1 Uncharacterised protein [Acinetobacter junii]SUU11554.1 Uncharacterised protein [Acinetobacter junii]
MSNVEKCLDTSTWDIVGFCNNCITDRCFFTAFIAACETVLLLSTQIKQKLHLHSEQVLHTDHHSLHLDQPQADSHSDQHHHDLNHQCPFCFFYGHLVAPPTLGIKEVFVRVQVRYLHLYQVFIGFFFSLQRLFLIPQGRAPPSTFSMYSFI